MKDGWKLVATIEALAIAALLVLQLGDGPAEVATTGEAGPANVSMPREGTPFTGTAPVSVEAESGARRELPARQPPPIAGDPVGQTLVGTVRDPDGAALNGGVLRFEGPAGKHTMVVFQAESGFAVSGFAPGRWRVQGTLQGYRKFDDEFEFPAGAALHRADFVFEPARLIKVRFLTAGGAPLAPALREAGFSWEISVSAIATLEHPGPLLAPIATSQLERNAQSRWHRDSFGIEAHDGILEVDARGAVFVSALLRNAVLQSLPAPTGTDFLEFRIPLESIRAALGQLRLRVVDAETGEPIPGALASLSDSQSSVGGSPCDAEGRIRFRAVRPGLLELELSAPAHERRRVFLTFAPGEDKDLGEVRLAAAMEVHGRVVDALGAGVEGATVAIGDVEDWQPGENYDLRSSVRSGADGSFRFPGLGRRRYLFWLLADSARVPRLVDTRGGDPGEIVLRQVQGTNTELVASWADSGDRIVSIRTADGLPVQSAPLGSGRTWRLALAPGSYAVRTGTPDGGFAEWPLEVGSAAIRLLLSE
ncbi:MAG TPA: hypothetical protein VGC54_03150 [Planctomycetota bacterium]